MKKKVPRLKSDKEAEAFLAQDLSQLDFSQFN
jgi:predicted DNA binding CopG/RHH family protein